MLFCCCSIFFSFLTLFFFTSNTYTNKTWSEVSGIELEEINRMEREFLLGVDFNLYVDKPTYEAWLNLLKGLVWAKERDCRRVANDVGRGRHQQQHVRGRERERAGDKPIPKKGYTTTGSTGPPSRVFTTPSAATATTKQTGRTGNPYPPTYRSPPRVRARSSSPTARSSVQSQTSYSSRKDYWAPEQQQTYVYAPNNAAVAASTTSANYANNEYAVNSTPPSSMDSGAYTRAAPTTSESRSAQASPSPALPVFGYAPSNSYAPQPSASAASSAYTHQQHSQSRPSSKRTADNAFSPTSTASFALAQPSKRPVSMGGLSMNMNVGSSGPHSTGTSPLDGLQSFSRMSLGMGGSPSEGTHEREREREKERERVEREREAEAERERERERQKARPPPVTLSTAYSYGNHGKSPRVPQVSFFFLVSWTSLLMTICRICISTHWRALLSRRTRFRRLRLPRHRRRRSLNSHGIHHRTRIQRAMHKHMCTLALGSERPGCGIINHRSRHRLQLRTSMRI